MNTVTLKYEHTCIRCQCKNIETEQLPYSGTVPLPCLPSDWGYLGYYGELCDKCLPRFQKLWNDFMTLQNKNV